MTVALSLLLYKTLSNSTSAAAAVIALVQTCFLCYSTCRYRCTQAQARNITDLGRNGSGRNPILRFHSKCVNSKHHTKSWFSHAVRVDSSYVYCQHHHYHRYTSEPAISYDLSLLTGNNASHISQLFGFSLYCKFHNHWNHAIASDSDTLSPSPQTMAHTILCNRFLLRIHRANHVLLHGSIAAQITSLNILECRQGLYARSLERDVDGKNVSRQN
jgi:hypothetical protein